MPVEENHARLRCIYRAAEISFHVYPKWLTKVYLKQNMKIFLIKKSAAFWISSFINLSAINPARVSKTPLTVDEDHPVCRRARLSRFRMQVQPHSRVLYFGHVAIQSNVRGDAWRGRRYKNIGSRSSLSSPTPFFLIARIRGTIAAAGNFFQSGNRGMDSEGTRKLEKRRRKRKRTAFRGAKNFKARERF